MRINVTIDDTLFKAALQVSEPGINKADLIREALKTYVRVMAAKRLAGLGGAAPQMSDTPSRSAGPAEA
jgi:hypothetical protein